MKSLVFILIVAVQLVGKEAGAEEVKLQPVSCEEGYVDPEASETRRLPPSKPPESYLIAVPNGAVEVTIKEEKRKSRISEDLAVIGKVITDGFKGLSKDVPVTRCVKYEQRLLRATVNVRAFDKDKKELRSDTFIAGPEESFYLSADMPVTDVKQLKVDSTTGTVLEKEKPASFYVSLNWKPWGDVYTNYPVREFYKNLAVKGMVKASSRPSESMGLGVGYNFKAVEVFVARVWTKDDASVGGGSIGTTPSTVFGVSFNVAKVADWLKGE